MVYFFFPKMSFNLIKVTCFQWLRWLCFQWLRWQFSINLNMRLIQSPSNAVFKIFFLGISVTFHVFYLGDFYKFTVISQTLKFKCTFYWSLSTLSPSCLYCPLILMGRFSFLVCIYFFFWYPAHGHGMTFIAFSLSLSRHSRFSSMSILQEMFPDAPLELDTHSPYSSQCNNPW